MLVLFKIHMTRKGMFWEDMDSAIFSDGNTQDIWNEVVRVSPPVSWGQPHESVDFALCHVSNYHGLRAHNAWRLERGGHYKRESHSAPHEWQRALMTWAMFVVKRPIIKDRQLGEWKQCGQFAWNEFLKISNRNLDHTIAQWDPNAD